MTDAWPHNRPVASFEKESVEIQIFRASDRFNSYLIMARHKASNWGYDVFVDEDDFRENRYAINAKVEEAIREINRHESGERYYYIKDKQIRKKTR